MYLGSSRSAVSNLSMNGAYVSILSGLHADDTFSFELALGGQEHRAVVGRAVVVWTDPGVGVGVRFDLSDEEKVRLAGYLEELAGGEGEADPAVAEVGDTTEYETPRGSRRTVAVGPGKSGGASKVWFRYFPPDEAP